MTKSVVWPWQERLMQTGFDGLLRNKTRPPRIPPPLAQPVVDQVVALTITDPHRIHRNHLKGSHGNHINAAAGYNFSLLLHGFA